MAATPNRFSTYTSISSSSEKKEEQKKDLWQTLLGEVATGKQFPQKNLLVLGENSASQKQFLDALSGQEQRQNLGRFKTEKIPEIANSFALGNTYYDVLETDQEGDILARISVYLLSSPSLSFASLVRPLLTPQSIPNTLVVVLLNWSKPWTWMRELHQWIVLLQKVIISLDMESKIALDENLEEWKERGRVGASISLDGTRIPAQTGDTESALPIGSGEWDTGLGLPLCVVCQNAERVDHLEKDQGWKEEQFDLVLQYMRTVLLKHGASLIYTSSSLPSPLRGLVHSSLGIKSLASKKDHIKHNVIDRDKIVVPPNWDSWSKIRVLRDGFEVEEVSNGWDIDLDQNLASAPANGVAAAANGTTQAPTKAVIQALAGSAVAKYEEEIRNPDFDSQLLANQDNDTAKFEPTISTQDFLMEQQKELENMKLKAEAEGDDSRRPKEDDESGYLSKDTEITGKIGPVRINMGGIQADAEDMLQRLKDRQAAKEPTSPTVEKVPEDMEKLSAFFTGLLSNKRPGT